MQSCLLKYQWVKLPRNRIPTGKGLMGHWMKLASRAAFRRGKAWYCGHINDVTAGTWAGGMVGLKSILGIKDRSKALSILQSLFDLGYLHYELNPTTKKLTYSIKDWVVKCSGDPCAEGTVYATEGYGFLCVPRNITARLVEQNHVFGELDAWLDLWCHTTWRERSNAFSFLAPSIQFNRYSSVLTLDSLGRRWNWEKTKVWRFFKKYADDFYLYKLPGSYGCLIFNTGYPGADELKASLPADIERILEEIRTKGTNAHKYEMTDHQYINRIIASYSPSTVDIMGLDQEEPISEGRVALLAPIYIRAYFSPECSSTRVEFDCQGSRYLRILKELDNPPTRGPDKRAGPLDLTGGYN